MANSGASTVITDLLSANHLTRYTVNVLASFTLSWLLDFPAEAMQVFAHGCHLKCEDRTSTWACTVERLFSSSSMRRSIVSGPSPAMPGNTAEDKVSLSMSNSIRTFAQAAHAASRVRPLMLHVAVRMTPTACERSELTSWTDARLLNSSLQACHKVFTRSCMHARTLLYLHLHAPRQLETGQRTALKLLAPLSQGNLQKSSTFSSFAGRTQRQSATRCAGI